MLGVVCGQKEGQGGSSVAGTGQREGPWGQGCGQKPVLTSPWTLQCYQLQWEATRRFLSSRVREANPCFKKRNHLGFSLGIRQQPCQESGVLSKEVKRQVMKIGCQSVQDSLIRFWSGSQEGLRVLFILMCKTARVGEESVVLLEARKTLEKIHQHEEVSAATAKSLQSCPTLCDPIPGILQARTLEWVAISFSSA